MEQAILPSPGAMTDFARSPVMCAKPKIAKDLDGHFISLTKQILAGQKPSISFEKVEAALATGRVSSDIIDDLEDAMFGVIMEESRHDESDSESVSMDEVLDFLRQR